MKWLGIVLVAVAMNCYGREAAGAYKKRAAFWQQAEDIVHWYITGLRSTADPPEKLWASFLHSHTLSQEQPSLTAWFASRGDSLALSREQQQELLAFAKGLGTTDLEGQLAHCARYGELFAYQTAKARELQQTKGKLIGRLWMLASVAVGLLLI